MKKTILSLLVSVGLIGSASAQNYIIDSINGLTDSVTVNTGENLNISGDLRVGFGGTGTLNINGGNVSNSGDVTIGDIPGLSTGYVSITDGQWRYADLLVIAGNSGNSGTLNINGGTVLGGRAWVAGDPGSTGTININGGVWSNSDVIAVGLHGEASMNINNGKVLDSYGEIGCYDGQPDSVVMTGGTWSNSVALWVGQYGTGSFSISGGTVQSYEGSIGKWSGSVGSASINGGIWTNEDVLNVGYSGTGSLTLSGNGIVTAANGIAIASQSGSVGTMNVGSIGGSDNAGAIIAPTISLGSGSATINLNQVNSTTISSTISGSGSVNQLGSGTSILSGSNTYTGTTTINAGTLLANNNSGSAVGSSLVIVNNGGTLGGNGIIGGATTILNGGNLIAGSSGVGALSFTENLTLSTGSKTTLSINSTTLFTSINIIGANINFAGGLVFNISSYTPTAGDIFTVFNMTSGATESGDFTSILVGETYLTGDNGIWIGTDRNGNTYQFNDSTGQFTVVSVPEPSTYALFGLGAVGMLMVIRRKKTV
jgi:autotransporter-associated beta strand protein/T5SS/PEP-CTERM-associated repeat protein